MARSVRPEGRTFLYPRLGYGQIVDRLAEEATSAGAELLTADRPTVLESPTSGEAQTSRGAGTTIALSSGRRIDARRVFWTASPAALIDVVQAGDAARTGRAAGTPPAPAHDIDYRGVILVYLTLDRAQYTPFDAHYVPTVDVPFVRLSEPKNYRDGPDPHHRTVLCAEVPASPGDPLWTAPDDDLAASVSDGIDRLGLPAVRPTAVHVIRLPRVYPRYDNDQVAQLDATVRRAGNIPGITLLGRQGLAVIDNLHHVLDMARTAVDCLGQDGEWDEKRWDLALSTFEAHVVED